MTTWESREIETVGELREFLGSLRDDAPLSNSVVVQIIDLPSVGTCVEIHKLFIEAIKEHNQQDRKGQ